MPLALLLLVALALGGCAANPNAPEARPPDFALSVVDQSGSVPPPYAYVTRTEVAPDGTGTHEVEVSHGGPSRTWTFALTDAEMDALYARLRDAGAFVVRWREDDNPPVGGGSVWVDATAVGRTAEVPAYVVNRQEEMRAEVEDAAETAVPPALREEARAWLREAQAEMSEG